MWQLEVTKKLIKLFITLPSSRESLRTVPSYPNIPISPKPDFKKSRRTDTHAYGHFGFLYKIVSPDNRQTDNRQQTDRQVDMKGRAYRRYAHPKIIRDHEAKQLIFTRKGKHH